MADERQILELRIHGVNNTKPEAMLGLDANDVEMFAGDKLGSFWRPTAAGRAKGDIDDRVEREAYSWGEMARRSIGGDSGWSKAVGVASRAGWALLLPFGLVNIAYWTRRVDDGPGAETEKSDMRWWRRIADWNGWGAATLRVGGLLLTLLLVVTACAVALDLVAVQCFVGKTKVCTALPSALDFLITMGQARRLALLSAVPLVLVLGLLGLSAATRVRYEQPDPAAPEPKKPVETTQSTIPDDEPRDVVAALGSHEVEAATVTPDWPLLAEEGFWSHRKVTGVTARLHLAAAAVVVSLATAVHILFGYSTDCEALNTAVNNGVNPFHFMAQCLPQAQASPRADWELSVIALGIAALFAILLSLIARSDYAVDVRTLFGPRENRSRAAMFVTDWSPVVLGGVVFVLQTVILVSIDGSHEPTVRYLIGTSAAPAFILTVLVTIGMTALLWRLAIGSLTRHAPNAIAISVIVLTAWIALDHNDTRRALITGAVVLLLLSILGFRKWLVAHDAAEGRQDAKMTAWNGSAPGVFLLLATFLAMLLSSAVVSATGNWLNSANTAASLADTKQPVSPQPIDCAYSCSTDLLPPNLEVPLPYMWFGAICLPLVVLIMVGVAGIAAWRSFRWNGGKNPGSKVDIKGSVLQKRRFAALAHRAERIVSWLALAGTMGIVASLGVSAWGLRPVYKEDGDYPFNVDAQQVALDVGMVLLAAGGLAVIGVAVGGIIVGGARPLGLAWDLMCFLPRSGHPLAPPCYAERAVPELIERCVDWQKPKQGAAEGAIVLSAHSLGSVLAVAVVLSPRVDKSRVSLLTYGSQLRAYFSRIFPELLGPTVLGIQACASSSLRTEDPWQDEIEIHRHEFELTDDGRLSRLDGAERVLSFDERAVTSTLTDGTKQLRWRNLWRRSDYLGFPVFGYPDNPIDNEAEEVVRVHYLAEVQTHSDYPKTDAYKDAFAELIAANLFSDEPSGPASPEP